MNQNLYDFSDLSDLPTDLGKRLSSSAVANPNVALYADIVVKASEAGLKIMSIGQIEAVAHRMGLDSKAQQTIRTALNSGVKAGLLFKPSRQTYATRVAVTEMEVSDSAPVDVLDETTVVPNSLDNSAPVPAPVAATTDAQIDPLA